VFIKALVITAGEKFELKILSLEVSSNIFKAISKLFILVRRY